MKPRSAHEPGATFTPYTLLRVAAGASPAAVVTQIAAALQQLRDDAFRQVETDMLAADADPDDIDDALAFFEAQRDAVDAQTLDAVQRIVARATGAERDD